MHTNVWCDLRSTGVFSQMREGFSDLEMGRGAGGSSRPSSRPGTLNTLSCSNPTWGAKSHGDALSLGPHRDSGVSTSRNEQLSQRSAILSRATTAGGQESKDTIHTAILSWAHTNISKYFEARFALSTAKDKERYTPLWTNTAEQHWATSTSFFCSFQKFPFPVLLFFVFFFSLPCAVSLKSLSCLHSKALLINAHTSS